MTQYVMLTNKEHQDIKIKTGNSKELGDNVNFVMTFPFEFRNIQSNYPIFFQKNPDTGSLYPVALLGFEPQENLFLSEQGWCCPYIPIMIRRQPFLIGFQKNKDTPDQKKAVVSIDVSNPRVNKSEGEALFLEHGGNSEFLQGITQNLELIHQAHEHSDAFINALLEHELLEQFSLDITLDNGSEHQLLGYYTINEDKLQNLSANALHQFSQKGYLLPAFMALASHSSIRHLTDLKNAALLKEPS